MIKFLGTVREVTHTATVIHPAHGDLISMENHNGILYLLQQIEHFLFTGDSSLAFDGEAEQWDGLDSLIDPTSVYDLEGNALQEADIEESANIILENYGFATDLFLGPRTLSDLGKGMQVIGTGSRAIGATDEEALAVLADTANQMVPETAAARMRAYASKIAGSEYEGMGYRGSAEAIASKGMSSEQLKQWFGSSEALEMFNVMRSQQNQADMAAGQADLMRVQGAGAGADSIEEIYATAMADRDFANAR
jgi:hypothetical protein